ncbi:hypothetical protein, partial [Salmonella sp. s55004]|uniref:hypothetical protein n=1 Tax=Salmonella sp. s55004 TaxID=3159675 RepID=UPI00398149C4
MTEDAVEMAPAAPADWKPAIRPPATTPPPLAIADADIAEAAKLPAAIPALPKPTLCMAVTANK